MERSEPTLVPEWLKGTGSGSGSATHHFPLSSSHSDDRGIKPSPRNRSSMSIGDYESPCSDRISSSYFRRSLSSNGSMVRDKDPSASSRAYSSFARSHRDRDWERGLTDFCEKERSFLGDLRDRDCSDPSVISPNVLKSRIEKDMLRRSQSMISSKRGEVRARNVAIDSNSVHKDHSDNNGVGGSSINSFHKAAFERHFPSLGAEESQVVSEIVGISSPRLSTAVQSLPTGTSAMIGGNGWTSALAEVPVVIGSNSMGLSSVQQTAPGNLSTVASSMTTGLNMAETLAQAPSRARTAPQLSVETQRLEELAIKQSRQLIPVTPSMAKTLVLNSEKQKPKAAARSEMTVANKIGQQQLSSLHPVNQAVRGGPAKYDVAKTSHGIKLLVRKGARENDNSPTTKDGLNLTNAGRTVNNPSAPLAAVAHMRGPNNPKPSVVERKASALPATLAPSMEKRSTMSQAQSRHDFFNLMRKKASVNFSSVCPDISPVVASTVSMKSDELITEVATAPVSPQGGDTTVSDSSTLDWSTENGGDRASNGSVCEESQGSPNNGEKHLSSDTFYYPEEEEAAFLRSLGWEENAGEEGGLTEEEISSFYEYMKLRPSLKPCNGMRQPKPPLLLGVSSGPNLTDSKPNA